MSAITPKERLLKVLNKERVDRPPVICTGGMMNAAIVEIMERTGHTLPEAHFDASLMSALAEDVTEATGFENLGIPFCMTVEAELLGSEIDHGTLACEPKIAKEAFPSVSAVTFGDLGSLPNLGRIEVVAEAAGLLSARNPSLPIIASLTGPISTAASVVDPITFFKELRKNPEGSRRVLAHVNDLLFAFAKKVLDAGADVIAIGDPTATGEILGPRFFEEFALYYLNDFIERVHALEAPVILHICGDMKKVRHLLTRLSSDAISTDAMVNLKTLKADFPSLTTMGNLSTYLLQSGDEEKIARRARELVRDGIDIISPACGLSTSTGIASVRALTSAVKGA